jgi:ankyrin repeat protein
MAQNAILAQDSKLIGYWLYDRSANEIDIDWQDANGDTVLIHAVRMKNADVIESVLSFDVMNINVQNNNGDTALIEAARGGDAAIVTMLLEACADAGILNNQGQTALDVALAQGHNNVVALLVNLVTNRNVISHIVAQQWETLPLEVLDHEIMSFL